MNENSSASAGTVVIAAAAGAVLGAGLALLLAPQSGRETRDYLMHLGRRRGRDGRDWEEDEEALDRARSEAQDWEGESRELSREEKGQGPQGQQSS